MIAAVGLIKHAMAANVSESGALLLLNDPVLPPLKDSVKDVVSVMYLVQGQ